MHIQSFDVSVDYLPGSKNCLADALSRNPVSKEIEHSALPSSENIEYTVCFLLQNSPLNLKTVAEATAKDPFLQTVIQAVQCNWQTVASRKLSPFYSFRDELSLKSCSHDVSENDFVLMKGNRVVLPSSLVSSFLDQIHSGHIGSSKMKSLTQSCAYWTGFSNDIDNYVHRCQSCTVFQRTADKPPLTEIANQATSSYEVISVDLCGPSESTQGKILLTIIDHYSRYPEVYILSRGSSHEIMKSLRSSFSKFGIPQKLLSDNGTPFVSNEFENFLANLGIKHVYSANYHPIANGYIERFHSTLKSRINRITYSQSVSFEAAIDKVTFDIRSTPNAMTGETPFYRFFSRPMRTKLSLLSECTASSSSRNASKEYANKYTGRVVSYKVNDRIFYRKGYGTLFNGKGKIIGVAGKNSYKILTENNLTRVYNQCDLKRRYENNTPVDYDYANDLYDSVPEQLPIQVQEHDTTSQKRYNLRRNRKHLSVYKD